MNIVIKLTGATDNRDIMLVSDRIILCEHKEDSTRVVYRIQGEVSGFGATQKDYIVMYVNQTVDEIYSLIHDKL